MSQSALTALCLALVTVVFLHLPLAAQTPHRFLALETSLQGEDYGNLRWPVGIAVASDESLAVADAFGKRLIVFVAGTGGWNVSETVTLPSAPRAVAYDGRRYKVSLSGGSLAEVAGGDWKRVALPEGVVAGAVAARTGGGLLLHDRAGGRVLVLGDQDQVLAEISVPGRFRAITSAPDGGFYTAWPDAAEVRRHNARGEILRTWKVPGQGPVPAWPSGLLADPGGDVVVVDRHGGRIVALDAAGRLVGVGAGQGWDPGQLMLPIAIAGFPDGRVLVADQGNSRVQIFRRLERQAQTP